MNAGTISQLRMTGAPAVASQASRPSGVRLLQAFALAVMLIPSTTVIGPLGAPGYPASLVGVAVFLVYTTTVLLGFYNPATRRHPIQVVLCLLWMSILASYLLMDRETLSAAQLKGADRFLIEFVVISGIALVAAEWINTLGDARRVVRALCWGGAFCGIVAALQYAFDVDLAHYLKELPGFTQNHDNAGIMARGSVRRVTGTAINPIELGVVAGMLIPLAIYLGMYDTQSRPMKRWAPAALITLGVGASVSRSAIVAIVVGFGVLVVLLPAVPRLGALIALPFAVAATFMSAHGLIGTLATFFTAGSSDSSIQARLHDYPLVESLFSQSPWFGHGGGTYLPVNSLDILDNQYLGTIVDLGAVGFFALLVFSLMPAVTALVARTRSKNIELRVLCAALAGSGFAAAACSATFDSLSFPMFPNVYALVIGLAGACWRLAAAEGSRKPDPGPHGAGPPRPCKRLLEPTSPRRATP